jgi:hypothetical protein
MEITIGAKCWNGAQRKSLSPAVKVEGLVVCDRQTFSEKLREGGRQLSDPKVRSILSYILPATLLSSMVGGVSSLAPKAFAAGAQPDVVSAFAISDVAKNTLLHAFDPLIGLIQSLAYPIAGVMIAGGCLFIMVGNREHGMKMLQNAAIGYILVQLSPMMLKLLVGIGGSM